MPIRNDIRGATGKALIKTVACRLQGRCLSIEITARIQPGCIPDSPWACGTFTSALKHKTLFAGE